ncbi:MAG: UDP-N-acetylmuramoyl-L-alanyl-D-glutamate--2,6-diaminopimelate ligase [Rhodospirillales bacterium]|nr:UDP-N-acetylmuramoyl-L-alanyl-D-glutamate--2,6-diaminopimelate ligase [Rhodospirillales bacterium]
MDLVKGLTEVNAVAIPPELEIAGIGADSRAMAPGFLFAALAGTKTDGRAFIADALARGAVAVLGPAESKPLAPETKAVFLSAANPRRAYALLAARFFARQPATVAAVTGTNGKTSTVHFLRQIWTSLGLRAAGIGTLGIVGSQGETLRAGGLTTPDPAELHQTLKELAETGIEHLALEASSHGLDQYRLDGVRLKAAAFTNLTRDHLDYHRDMAAYLVAKRRLFAELLPEGATAVIHLDAPGADTILDACRARRLKVITYGEDDTDIALRFDQATPGGRKLDLSLFGARRAVEFPLVGLFQAENALCALGLAIACGADARAAVAALEHLGSVPGRLEKAGETKTGAAVYVDYAHTPDALVHVLGALRPHARRKLSLVFGCGGERDPGKRAEMGRIAAHFADATIVTDDNPRGEDPVAIRRAILAACPGAVEIADRREAIRAAVARLKAGDVLVLAGRGHERVQIVGTDALPFDDAAEARAALGEAKP